MSNSGYNYHRCPTCGQRMTANSGRNHREDIEGPYYCDECQFRPELVVTPAELDARREEMWTRHVMELYHSGGQEYQTVESRYSEEELWFVERATA